MFISFIDAWKNAFNFKGLTSRKDYWSFQLISFIVGFLINLLLYFSAGWRYNDVTLSLLSYPIYYSAILYFLGSVLVQISMSIRRLRDIGKPLIYIFINLIPILGSLYFIYLMIQTSVIEKIDSNDQSLEEKLSDLLNMKNKKLITESEYKDMKNKILDL